MSFSDTQLTTASGFTGNNIIFGEPQENNFKLGDGKNIKFFRIPVGVKNPDGTTGKLVFSTEKLFSFGVQENKNDKGKIDGYSAPLCMWNKDGATKEQLEWLKGFDAAVDVCKNHILDVKDDVEKYDLEESELKRFNPMYWKRERGKIVEGRGPTLYPKLLVSKKESPPKILTSFEDESGNDIDPHTLIGKWCWMQAAIKIESIFIGSKVSLQVKLYEAIARPLQNKARKLLRPTADKKVRLMSGGDLTAALGVDNKDDSDSDIGSLNDSDASDDEVVESPKKSTKKKVVRRTVVRKKKKEK
jgi:hypothetical protein